MIQCLLLATDGSKCASRAADFAASLALRYPAKIVVLNVLTLGYSHLSGIDQQDVFSKAQGAAQILVNDVAQHLREIRIKEVDPIVLYGPPVSVILGFAEMHKPDLIVMGARGDGTWQGKMLGSVSMAVTQRAECPVLVVK